MPVSFPSGPLEEIKDINELLKSYDDHATVLAQSTDAQSVLNRLFGVACTLGLNCKNNLPL
jgi:hypothetical protein